MSNKVNGTSLEVMSQAKNKKNKFSGGKRVGGKIWKRGLDIRKGSLEWTREKGISWQTRYHD